MKKLTFAFLITILIAAVFPATGYAATGLRLVAGQNQIVGHIFIWNDLDNIYVQFNMKHKLGFCLMETHLHLANDWSEIPQTKSGNPKVGHFDYSGEHDCEDIVTYSIPIGDWEPNDEITIAAHAVANNWIFPDYEETAWGAVCGNIGHNQFPGSNWAVYAPYLVKENSKPPINQ